MDDGKLDFDWTVFPMSRSHKSGNTYKRIYTLYRKGIEEPLITNGTVKEVANLMGVDENYVYVMFCRNNGENGRWKIVKTNVTK